MGILTFIGTSTVSEEMTHNYTNNQYLQCISFLVLLRVRYIHISRPLNTAICNMLKFDTSIYFMKDKMVMKAVAVGKEITLPILQLSILCI